MHLEAHNLCVREKRERDFHNWGNFKRKGVIEKEEEREGGNHEHMDQLSFK